MKPARSTKYLIFAFLLSSAGYPLASYAGPVCGDGEPEGEEECDNGGDTPDNSCTNNFEQGNGPCTDTFCGDMVTQNPNADGFPEDCDGTPGCNPDCSTSTTTTTTEPTTTTTAAATTTTTEPTTTTTAEATTTTTAGATTTTTAGATTTTTVGATTTTTAAATTTTTAVATTTTTQAPGECSPPTVVIDGCDSGVTNSVVSGGSCLSDSIDASCPTNVNGHGKYVRCVAHTTRDLKRAGDITGKEKGRIVRCAARSDIGKKNR